MAMRVGSRAILLFSLVYSGCSSGRVVQPHVRTTPLIGTVHVDGKPADGLTVECYRDSAKHPSNSTPTKADGEFSFGTYKLGDGLPEGTYRLTFKWKSLAPGEVDKLHGAYADPTKSKYTVTIEIGEPIDLGVIELSTKGPIN
jgi:5-hydroxyisourate hydrolase-like protein (transthyretin family)